MGQLFSSEEERSRARDAIGAVLFDAMLDAGAVPNLRVVHPLLLSNDDTGARPGPSIQEQMQQLQRDIGSRAPTYLRDLIGRLSAFTDEPRLAGLVGSVVSMVIDMAYASSKPPSGKNAGSSSRQRVSELQELMEEYLKRCRINLNDKNKLMQDTSRLETQLSLNLTQLKTCLLRGDCDSRSLRQWASGAAFHTQMLVHLAGLEGQMEALAARGALLQYREDLEQIIPVYRKYKAGTVSALKCRGSLSASHGESGDVLEEGAMTGLTVTDRETGASVTIPLCELQTQTERRLEAGLSDGASDTSDTSLNLDLISCDDYAQAYLQRFFSDQGPVGKIETYFRNASDSLSTLTTKPKKTKRPEESAALENKVHVTDSAESAGGQTGALEVKGEGIGCTQRTQNFENESLKLSIVEMQSQI
ncbi:uncharacterized protein LOC117382518 [Periophthalmus magnuspinnatus]|uniref:uncharacterized protein LOC117382518 n=1 Tax=Periophthalmus magnuspinnatus TaxID=409849 RepID=UPI00145BF1E3|nr:uncharacterized protein LOC117382518 [Periophthalmus magnuspinnatus]XP_055083195.1 uncharacterized protein LOC117382518 [Periophthalmus magnuspinnatus]XP_055083196.1 uncharacterized protein LOC117382518 [Periophthalmus magnuspinnatus]